MTELRNVVIVDGCRTPMGRGKPDDALTCPTAADLADARNNVAMLLRPTPLVPVQLPGLANDTELWLKLDTMQPTGSFKLRGAVAALAAYQKAGNTDGIVTASAGNHALAVTFASRQLGVAARVVVAENASPVKVAALRRLGAELVMHGDSYDAAEEHALELAERGGSSFVSPYNDPYVIAGQATLAAEVADQLPDLDALVLPVGGRGLISGCCMYFATVPEVVVAGVEAAASLGLSAAVAAGSVVPVDVRPTLADGLAGNLEPGSITAGIAANRINELTSVTEDELRAAIRSLCLDAGLVAEGSGAVGVAALLAGKLQLAGRVVVACTGRNIPTPALLAILGTSHVG